MQARSSNTEVFMLLPALGAFHAFLRYADRGRARDIALAGALGALSLTVKTVALPQVLVLAIMLLLVKPAEDQVRGHLARLALFAAPGIALLAAIGLYFAWHGAWEELVYWNVTFILGKYKSHANAAVPLADTLRTIAPELLVPALAAAFGLARLSVARRPPEVLATALLVPATIAGVFLPGKNFAHYFVQLLPILCVIGGFGLDQLWSGRRAILLPGALVLTIAFGSFTVADLPFYVSYTPQQVSTLKYGGPYFADAEDLSKFLRERTQPDDYIFQWGFEPEIYFLSGRRSPVPYLASLLVGLDRDPERALETLAIGLAARPPRYVVLYGSEMTATGSAVVIAALRERYVLEGRSGYFAVFRLREREDSDASGTRSTAGSTPG
jgi:hypothetical protein